MTLFNADGSRAEVSGNGVRGLAALLLRDDDRDGVTVTIETDAGAKQLTRITQSVPGTCLAPLASMFRAAMGLPGDIREVTLTAAGETVTAITLNFGNPQCVVLGTLPDRPAIRGARHGTGAPHRVPARHERRVRIGRGVRYGSHSDLGARRRSHAVVGHWLVRVTGRRCVVRRREPRRDVIAPGGAQHVEWTDDNVYLTGCGRDPVRRRVAAADSAYRVNAPAAIISAPAAGRRRGRRVHIAALPPLISASTASTSR